MLFLLPLIQAANHIYLFVFMILSQSPIETMGVNLILERFVPDEPEFCFWGAVK